MLVMVYSGAQTSLLDAELSSRFLTAGTYYLGIYLVFTELRMVLLKALLREGVPEYNGQGVANSVAELCRKGFGGFIWYPVAWVVSPSLRRWDLLASHPKDFIIVILAVCLPCA